MESRNQRKRETSTYRTDNRLRNKGTHILRPDALKLRVQLGRQPRNVVGVRLAVLLTPVGVAGRDVRGVLREKRLERLAAEDVAAGCEGSQRDAVIGGGSGDEARTLGLGGG